VRGGKIRQNLNVYKFKEPLFSQVLNFTGLTMTVRWRVVDDGSETI
jgi:hypothetical protein